MSGRPLRFLGSVIGLWTLGRIVGSMLPDTSVPTMTPASQGAAAGSVSRATPLTSKRPVRWSATPRTKPVIRRSLVWTPPRRVAEIASVPTLTRSHDDAWHPASERTEPPTPGTQAAEVPIPAANDRVAPAPRWRGSLWGIIREDGGRALLPGGQLGGTQMGIRLLRRLDARGDIAASVRLSAPWRGIGREMALGVECRPIRSLPVRLLVEHRIALDSGQGGPAALVVTGIGPRVVAPGVTLNAYAQAGAVMRTRLEPFADGAARIGTALSPGVDVALGAWGGAQRDARRLDIGPSLGLALPIGERRARLSLEWRERILGRAVPGSGPALSLAGDF